MAKAFDTLPEDFLNRLKEMYEPKLAMKIANGLRGDRPTTFRINTLKATEQEIDTYLHEHQIETEKVAWFPLARILKNASLHDLSLLSIYIEGKIYVQSLSSMIPPLILDPKPNELVLDLTAAPGSKTTQMAVMMENTGKIIANDNSRIRIYKLEANCKQQGITNTQVQYGIGQTVWQQYPEYFDKTLVDVPCSMEGRFDYAEPKSYTHWTKKKVKDLADKQKWLLRSAISATKPGGIIVYSTCTLSPEENEGVIHWILTKEKGNITIEPIELDSLHPIQPMMSWKNTVYHTDVRQTYRIQPNSLFEGFFVAKIRKTTSTIPDALKHN